MRGKNYHKLPAVKKGANSKDSLELSMLSTIVGAVREAGPDWSHAPVSPRLRDGFTLLHKNDNDYDEN